MTARTDPIRLHRRRSPEEDPVRSVFELLSGSYEYLDAAQPEGWSISATGFPLPPAYPHPCRVPPTAAQGRATTRRAGPLPGVLGAQSLRLPGVRALLALVLARFPPGLVFAGARMGAVRGFLRPPVSSISVRPAALGFAASAINTASRPLRAPFYSRTPYPRRRRAGLRARPMYVNRWRGWYRFYLPTELFWIRRNFSTLAKPSVCVHRLNYFRHARQHFAVA